MCVVCSVHAYMMELLLDMTEISPVQLDRACLLMNAWTVNPIPGGCIEGVVLLSGKIDRADGSQIITVPDHFII